jgi:hypothetical protein
MELQKRGGTGPAPRGLALRLSQPQLQDRALAPAPARGGRRLILSSRGRRRHVLFRGGCQVRLVQERAQLGELRRTDAGEADQKLRRSQGGASACVRPPPSPSPPLRPPPPSSSQNKQHSKRRKSQEASWKPSSACGRPLVVHSASWRLRIRRCAPLPVPSLVCSAALNGDVAGGAAAAGGPARGDVQRGAGAVQVEEVRRGTTSPGGDTANRESSAG